MRKRGQAAAFIIIGLVLLIVVIGILAVKTSLLDDLFGRISGERRAIPQQVKPIQDFLDSCVTQVTKEAVDRVALQGGYLNLPQDPIPSTPFTPLGPSLEILEGSDLKTAVWFRERGNGIQELNIPTEQNIENGISEYLTENFAICVNNLTKFQEQGFLISANAIPETTVELSDNKVSTTVEFPINIKILDTNFTLSEHHADVDSNLGKLYQMAKEIVETENKEFFLENKTIDMLVAYDPEVPFSGTDLSCTEKIWRKDEVETKLKEIIYENVAAMHIKGTNYELQDDKFKYLEFDALEDTDRTVTANLMYIPNWPTLVEVTPSEGNILRSDNIIKKAAGPVGVIASSFFCLNTHRFVYDIKYPVLISLRDSNGLTFQFATQVIIDNNEPRQNRIEILDLPDTTSPICQYPQKPVSIVTTAVTSTGGLIPLSNVSLNFKCFPASCDLGTSSLTSEGQSALNAVVPLCYNGIIEGTKEGFKQVEKTIYSSNEKNALPTVIVKLEPISTKEVKLFVIDKSTGATREPYDTEQISFQFINTDTTYQTNYIYSSEENIIQLLPGNYIINSYLLRNSSTYTITIPGETLETCVDTRDLGLFGLFNKNQVCKTTDIEPMEFEIVLTGGATGFEHEFTREELAKDAPLNLYVLSSAIPGSFEDLQKIQIQLETNKDHPLFREPTIA